MSKPTFTRRSYGPRVDLLRIAPSTWRVYLDGQPLSATYDHFITANRVALAVVEVVRMVAPLPQLRTQLNAEMMAADANEQLAKNGLAVAAMLGGGDCTIRVRKPLP